MCTYLLLTKLLKIMFNYDSDLFQKIMLGFSSRMMGNLTYEPQLDSFKRNLRHFEQDFKDYEMLLTVL